MKKIKLKTNFKNWEKEKKKEWKKNAQFWIKIIREKRDPFRLVVTNKAVLEILKKEKNLKILDAGCGEGYLCRILAKKGHKVFGIDSCQELIKAAQQLEDKKPLGIKYFLGDFRKTNFKNNFFDVVLSHQSINEVENPEKAIKEFWRILKKGGKVICLFLHPCFDFLPHQTKKLFSLLYFEKVKVEKGKYLVGGLFSPSPYFYLHLPLSKWIEFFEKNNFKILTIKEPHPPFLFLKKNKWWRENFSKPRFILIVAQKP